MSESHFSPLRIETKNGSVQDVKLSYLCDAAYFFFSLQTVRKDERHKLKYFSSESSQVSHYLSFSNEKKIRRKSENERLPSFQEQNYLSSTLRNWPFFYSFGCPCWHRPAREMCQSTETRTNSMHKDVFRSRPIRSKWCDHLFEHDAVRFGKDLGKSSSETSKTLLSLSRSRWSPSRSV